MPIVTLVAATRETKDGFFSNTALGKTLSTYARYDIRARLFFGNKMGLPECYNMVIDATDDEDEILVFLHDDVYLTDHFWMQRLIDGLQEFSMVGVAGNNCRAPGQPAWCFTKVIPEENVYQPDESHNLSGTVAHGDGFPCKVNRYGPEGQACLLLDGVLLAARKSSFIENGVRFDPRFRFHFYDLDICRQFEQAGLTMGTAAISVIHQSGGNFASPEWASARQAYLDKWGE